MINAVLPRPIVSMWTTSLFLICSSRPVSVPAYENESASP